MSDALIIGLGDFGARVVAAAQRRWSSHSPQQGEQGKIVTSFLTLGFGPNLHRVDNYVDLKPALNNGVNALNRGDYHDVFPWVDPQITQKWTPNEPISRSLQRLALIYALRQGTTHPLMREWERLTSELGNTRSNGVAGQVRPVLVVADFSENVDKKEANYQHGITGWLIDVAHITRKLLKDIDHTVIGFTRWPTSRDSISTRRQASAALQELRYFMRFASPDDAYPLTYNPSRVENSHLHPDRITSPPMDTWMYLERTNDAEDVHAFVELLGIYRNPVIYQRIQSDEANLSAVSGAESNRKFVQSARAQSITIDQAGIWREWRLDYLRKLLNSWLQSVEPVQLPDSVDEFWQGLYQQDYSFESIFFTREPATTPDSLIANEQNQVVDHHIQLLTHISTIDKVKRLLGGISFDYDQTLSARQPPRNLTELKDLHAKVLKTREAMGNHGSQLRKGEPAPLEKFIKQLFHEHLKRFREKFESVCKEQLKCNDAIPSLKGHSQWIEQMWNQLHEGKHKIEAQLKNGHPYGGLDKLKKDLDLAIQDLNATVSGYSSSIFQGLSAVETQKASGCVRNLRNYLSEWRRVLLLEGYLQIIEEYKEVLRERLTATENTIERLVRVSALLPEQASPEDDLYSDSESVYSLRFKFHNSKFEDMREQFIKSANQELGKRPRWDVNTRQFLYATIGPDGNRITLVSDEFEPEQILDALMKPFDNIHTPSNLQLHTFLRQRHITNPQIIQHLYKAEKLFLNLDATLTRSREITYLLFPDNMDYRARNEITEDYKKQLSVPTSSVDRVSDVVSKGQQDLSSLHIRSLIDLNTVTAEARNLLNPDAIIAPQAENFAFVHLKTLARLRQTSNLHLDDEYLTLLHAPTVLQRFWLAWLLIEDAALLQGGQIERQQQDALADQTNQTLWIPTHDASGDDYWQAMKRMISLQTRASTEWIENTYRQRRVASLAEILRKKPDKYNDNPRWSAWYAQIGSLNLARTDQNRFLQHLTSIMQLEKDAVVLEDRAQDREYDSDQRVYQSMMLGAALLREHAGEQGVRLEAELSLVRP